MPPIWRILPAAMDWMWKRHNNRAIVHLNIADFAVAVERVIDSRLKTRPVIVAVPGQNRAAVYDVSEEAFQAGVQKGMAIPRAMRICPEAVVIPPHFHHYERAMGAFLKHTQPYSPLIEAEEANGHVFLDLTGTGRLFGPAADLAWRIRKEVRSDLGFDPIWSLAPNKLLAKVASRIVKPTGEYIVREGEEEDFLKPLPIQLLPGWEREDRRVLQDFHITHTGQLGLWTPEQWQVAFGKRGLCLQRMIRGEDPTPVRPFGQKEDSIQSEYPFGDDTNDREQVESVLFRLVEKIGFELRRRQRIARQMAIRLDYSDGVRIFRQKNDAQGTANDFKLFSWARTMLDMAWTRRIRIRAMRLSCNRLAFPSAQLSLFAEMGQEEEQCNQLMVTIDHLRRRFGKGVLQYGAGALQPAG